MRLWNWLVSVALAVASLTATSTIRPLPPELVGDVRPIEAVPYPGP